MLSATVAAGRSYGLWVLYPVERLPGVWRGFVEGYDMVGVRRVRPPWGGHKVPGSILCGPGAQHLFPALVRTGFRLGEAKPVGGRAPAGRTEQWGQGGGSQISAGGGDLAIED